MHPEFKTIICNQRGVGLIAAIFIVVIVSLFGVLIARYTQTTSVASAEDYLWGQALYAAESGARLRMLLADGGGNWSGGVWADPTINNFNVTIVNHPDISTDLHRLSSRASQASISRTIEVKYSTE